METASSLNTSNSDEPITAPPSARSRSIFHVLVPAAWISICLGVAVESLVLLTRFAAGTSTHRNQALIEFATSVSWSTIVCAGIALGTAAVRQRDRMMGLLGLVCAPLGWALAKGVQRGTQWMLGTPLDTIGSLVFQVGALKTVEYSLLGFLAGKLAQLPHSTLIRYTLLGFGIGTVFGSAVVGVNLLHAPGHALPPAKLLSLSTNELLFPIGCAAVLYFITRLADQQGLGVRAEH